LSFKGGEGEVLGLWAAARLGVSLVTVTVGNSLVGVGAGEEVPPTPSFPPSLALAEVEETEMEGVELGVTAREGEGGRVLVMDGVEEGQAVRERVREGVTVWEGERRLVLVKEGEPEADGEGVWEAVGEAVGVVNHTVVEEEGL